MISYFWWILIKDTVGTINHTKQFTDIVNELQTQYETWINGVKAKNKEIMKSVRYLLLLMVIAQMSACVIKSDGSENSIKPNILFAIADDQSYPYASVYGTKGINTPAFDLVAKSGVLFHNAFAAAPQCSPSRAAILTGKNIWQLEEAGTHASNFPKKFPVFTDLLEEQGYELGYTGKPWGPGNWQITGWKRNPVGPEYNELQLDEVPASGINRRDYYGNFKQFLDSAEASKPFFFWYGCHEPHRRYEAGSGVKSGMNEEDVELPSFLPDDSVTRNDVMDYAFEIEYFDSHLKKMIDLLAERGALENTMIVVTADNGMPFPYAKANVQEYGTHVPLAISWPKGIKSVRQLNNLVSMIDLAPTFLELAGVMELPNMTGKSILQILTATENEDLQIREFVMTGRERHTHARPHNLGYPARAIRTEDFLFVKNYKPDRWPAGDPVEDTEENRRRAAVKGFSNIFPGYLDIDGSPSKSFLMEHAEDFPLLFQLAFLKRPEEQLYDVRKDAGCLHNLSDDPAYAETKNKLRKLLDDQLTAQGDPRMFGSEIFDSYPRYSSTRNFEGFNKRGEYNPDYK